MHTYTAQSVRVKSCAIAMFIHGAYNNHAMACVDSNTREEMKVLKHSYSNE